MATEITIKRLPTGYYHIRGKGPCEWSQPPELTEEAIRAHAFPEASEDFIRSAINAAEFHNAD